MNRIIVFPIINGRTSYTSAPLLDFRSGANSLLANVQIVAEKLPGLVEGRDYSVCVW